MALRSGSGGLPALPRLYEVLSAPAGECPGGFSTSARTRDVRLAPPVALEGRVVLQGLRASIAPGGETHVGVTV